jgi:hypothetical protein
VFELTALASAGERFGKGAVRFLVVAAGEIGSTRQCVAVRGPAVDLVEQGVDPLPEDLFHQGAVLQQIARHVAVLAVLHEERLELLLHVFEQRLRFPESLLETR